MSSATIDSHEIEALRIRIAEKDKSFDDAFGRAIARCKATANEELLAQGKQDFGYFSRAMDLNSNAMIIDNIINGLKYQTGNGFKLNPHDFTPFQRKKCSDTIDSLDALIDALDKMFC